MLQERNANMRTQNKDGKQMKQDEVLMKKKEKAEMLKCEKQEAYEHVNMSKQQEQLKNASIKQMIKN